MFGLGSIPLDPRRIYQGPNDSSIFLDDVICQGDELSLLSCDHAPLFEANCDPSDVAGVSCEGTWHKEILQVSEEVKDTSF